MRKGQSFWLLPAVMILAIFLRLPGIPWGITSHDYFEPDEGQHAGIGKNFINTFDNAYVKDAEVTLQFNARGFGTQTALVSYPFLKMFRLPSHALYFSGRLLSLAYSLLLILLIYHITITITRNKNMALLSALLLSVFDLNVIYSHYGVPDIAHTFWYYLSIFMLFMLFKTLAEAGIDGLQRRMWLIIFSPLSVAMGLAFRFDPVPMIFLLAGMGALAARKKMSFRNTAYLLVIFVILICGFFSISVGFNYSIKDFLLSKFVVGDFDVIKSDTHLLYNPLLYFFAVLSGTSMPLVVSFGASFFFFHFRERDYDLRRFNYLSLGLLSVSFILLWAGDSTFVRRANIFLPYIAMMSGYGLVHFLEAEGGFFPKTGRIIILSLIILYTAGLSLVSQTHFFRDTRYKAADYLNEHYTPADTIAYSVYAKTESMPRGVSLEAFSPSVKTIVLHETYYGRYWKYFATPFIIPKCCEEVFHCSYNDCVLIQNLFSNATDYRLVKRFEVKHPFPERVLFKHLFGTYETHLGDVLIYEKEVASPFITPVPAK